MSASIPNIVLIALVVILAVLLAMRQRQLKKARPLKNLEQVLESLRHNLLSNRTEGKIQKVASNLSDILITHLQSERILFFRKQRRLMEMNYVYGLRNIQRARFRIKLSNALTERLTDDRMLRHPQELADMLPAELAELLEKQGFNIAFPIFWQDNLFGVYFICTALPTDHPLINAFLLFLNQNLSAAYQITRLESARQILESRVKSDARRIQQLEADRGVPGGGDGEDDPGHLIEMFGHRKVDELVASLFRRVKAGLRADKLIFMARPGREAKTPLRYTVGTENDDFSLDGDRFQTIFGRLRKRQVYNIQKLGEVPGGEQLRAELEKEQMRHFSTFSLSDKEPGLLFWGSEDDTETVETRLLGRLEQVAQRALTNAREFERVEEMSYTDSLTGLYNHRYFMRRLGEEIQRAIRYNRKLGLLLFDIDDFKLYNDNFGHQWGDKLLREMGRKLSRSLRAIDVVARYGGDEFGIIMPEADKTTCRISMDRLRHAITATDFRDQADGFEGRITISIGSAIFPDDAEAAERLVYCADMALLQSKSSGRNCGTIFEPDLLKQKEKL